MGIKPSSAQEFKPVDRAATQRRQFPCAGDDDQAEREKRPPISSNTATPDIVNQAGKGAEPVRQRVRN